jgi:hypothetical protein
VDCPAGFAHRGHPQTTVGFDRHRDRVCSGVAGFGHSINTCANPAASLVTPARATDYPRILIR